MLKDLLANFYQFEEKIKVKSKSYSTTPSYDTYAKPL